MGKLQISNHCKVCQQRKEMIVEQEEYDKWQQGELAQRAFKSLSAGEREFIISGICEPCFDKVFGGE